MRDLHIPFRQLANNSDLFCSWWHSGIPIRDSSIDGINLYNKIIEYIMIKYPEMKEDFKIVDNIEKQNEIELKYFVSSEILVTKKRELNIICELETSPITSCNDIVIYFVKNDENLWDIGKKYSIRQEDIIKLNNLESCDLKKGQKLLIPVK